VVDDQTAEYSRLKPISPMFTKKKRQISTWKLALMAATCVAGVAGGGVPGLIVVIVLASIVGVYLIWTKL